jgi:hypothetical protein
MIIRFSWTSIKNITPIDNQPDYDSQHFSDIFLKHKTTSDSILPSSFVLIDITKLYDQYIGDRTSPVEIQKSPMNSTASPRSMDYLDNRLFASTPPSLLDHLLDEKKLEDQCFVKIGDDHILFDCNFEQLALIVRILESSIEFHPLHQKEGSFYYSNHTILPNLSTQSYTFTFEITKNLMDLFSYGSHQDFLTVIIQNLSGNKKAKFNQQYGLKGNDGIFVSVVQPQNNHNTLLRFHVGEEFTKNAILMDITSIQKSSIFFFNLVLEGFMSDKTNNEIKKLHRDLNSYVI